MKNKKCLLEISLKQNKKYLILLIFDWFKKNKNS